MHCTLLYFKMPLKCSIQCPKFALFSGGAYLHNCTNACNQHFQLVNKNGEYRDGIKSIGDKIEMVYEVNLCIKLLLR